MAKLRFYKAGKGDCIALREGWNTKLIFDTGQARSYHRGESIKKCKGFAKAIAETVGIQNRRNKNRKPPVVIISHVDEDHIGGLQGWVNDILSRTNNWREASKLAREEIAEVWCNIPPQDVALTWRADLPINYAIKKYKEHAKGFDEQEVPFPESDWQNEIWTKILKRWHKNDNNESPDEILKILIERQKLIQNYFNTNTTEIKDEDITEIEIDKFEKIWNWILEAYKDYLKIHNSNGIQILEISNKNDNQKSQTSYLDQTLILIIETIPSKYFNTDYTPECDFSFRIYIGGRASGASLNYRDKLIISSRLIELILPSFTVIRRKKKRRSLLKLNIEIRMPLDSNEIPLTTYESVKAISNKLNGLIENLDTSNNQLEALACMIDILENDKYFKLSQNNRYVLTLLRLLFGIAPIDGVKERLCLFKVLELLDIPVKGTFAKGYLGVDARIKPNIDEVDYVFLSPSRKEINDLEKSWDDYEEKLSVYLPTTFPTALIESFSAPMAFKWRPDRSVSNLSSIAIWIKNIASRKNVILTGDALHKKIMEQLQDKVRKLNKKYSNRFHYQIPHHGGRHNTNIKKDPLPGDILCNGKKISGAFASGGLSKAHNKKRKQGPIKSILNYFEKGTRKKPIPINEMFKDGKDIFDIKL